MWLTEFQTSGLCCPFFRERGQHLCCTIVYVFGWQTDTAWLLCVRKDVRREIWSSDNFKVFVSAYSQVLIGRIKMTLLKKNKEWPLYHFYSIILRGKHISFVLSLQCKRKITISRPLKNSFYTLKQLLRLSLLTSLLF